VSVAPQPTVYLNGTLVPQNQALIPVTDRGFLYGDGLFETVPVHAGRPFAVVAHFARLKAGAAQLGIALPFDRHGFADILEAVRQANSLSDALLRVTITRGSGVLPVPDPSGCHQPTVVVMGRPMPAHTDGDADWGIAAVIAPQIATPAAVLDPTVKSGNFLSHILATAYARAHGAGEAILLHGNGTVAEGATSNLFGVWNGTLNTPAADGSILPGITRRVVLDLAKKLAIPLREGTIAEADLAMADELFVTNSGWGVMALTQLNQAPVGDGQAGPVSLRLRDAYRAHVAFAP